MLRKLLYICLFLLLPGLGFCRTADTVKKPKPKAVLFKDTATIQLRSFDSTALKNYARQREFIYTGESQGEPFWTTFWKWLKRKIYEFFSKGKRGATFGFFLKMLLLLAGAAALGFLIFKLIGIDIVNVFGKKPSKADLPYSELIENIHEINFDEGIEQAVARHNYRLAVRLMYLKCLKQLTDAGLIHWEINKTNVDYSNELADFDQRLAFNLLTRQFEYIWYGNFIIDGPVFGKVSAMFKDFKDSIKA